MRLYRAVSEAEFQQLMRTRKFEVIPSSLEAKFFAESATHARRWGTLFGGDFRVIAIELPDARAAELIYFAHLDGIGPARVAELYQLDEAQIVGEVS